jgi:hypothetical protein
MYIHHTSYRYLSRLHPNLPFCLFTHQTLYPFFTLSVYISRPRPNIVFNIRSKVEQGKYLFHYREYKLKIAGKLGVHLFVHASDNVTDALPFFHETCPRIDTYVHQSDYEKLAATQTGVHGLGGNRSISEQLAGRSGSCLRRFGYHT